jgi:hypothetical protein
MGIPSARLLAAPLVWNQHLCATLSRKNFVLAAAVACATGMQSDKVGGRARLDWVAQEFTRENVACRADAMYRWVRGNGGAPRDVRSPCCRLEP